MRGGFVCSQSRSLRNFSLTFQPRDTPGSRGRSAWAAVTEHVCGAADTCVHVCASTGVGVGMCGDLCAVGVCGGSMHKHLPFCLEVDWNLDHEQA